MRIAINCRSFLKGQYTGIGRYAYHLVKSLSEIDLENTYQLYARKGMFSFQKQLPHFSADNFIPRWDLFNRGPEHILKNVDLYHMPSPGPLEAPLGAKIVVTVHDVIIKAFPQVHTPETVRAGEIQLKNIKDRASKIVCCSKSTMNDLERYFQIPRERMALVYQGVDKSVFYRIGHEETQKAEEMLVQQGIMEPFILSVGTIEPRKNLLNVIRAMGILRGLGRFTGQLVVVGMKGWMQDNVNALIDELGLKEHIKFLGYLADEELRYLYNKAAVFTFPSFYEGFGFPIIEAFCCGAPVVTSNVSSCPEIAGDAALTVDPNSVNDIAEAIGKILGEPLLREELSAKGLRRSEMFSFQKTAEETLNVYKEVCGVE